MRVNNNKTAEYNIVSFFLLGLFSVFPLFLISVRLQGITIRGVLISVFTAAAAIMYIRFMSLHKSVYRKQFYRIDLCMTAILFGSIGQVILQVLQGREGNELYLLLSISVLIYFMLSGLDDEIHEFNFSGLLDLYLCACSVIYLVLLVCVFVVPKSYGPIGLLAEDKATLKSFLVLSASTGILQYCSNRKKSGDKAYLAVTAVGFFLIFRQKDTLGILLVGALLLMIPALFLATAELIKRDLRMLFLFFIMFSCMPVLTNYTKLIKGKLSYSIQNSIYLDLIIVGVGILVCSYWERVPQNVPPDRLVMNLVRKAYLFVLKLCGILLFSFWCIGSMEDMEGRIGINVLMSLSGSLKTGFKQIDGTFGQVLQAYGVLGPILTGITFSVILARLRSRFSGNPRSAVLTAFTIMFMAQSFFYKQQSVTTPVYSVLVTLALFQNKSRENYNENKQKNEMDEHAAVNNGVISDAVGEYSNGIVHEATGGNE